MFINSTSRVLQAEFVQVYCTYMFLVGRVGKEAQNHVVNYAVCVQ